ncbi:LytTR family DNA-binding domain-containing protein [Bacteroides sp.]|uniref:LytR/AlgR family response regulator transcription factor n=1 Tax=Bacteroides sp. TaxID=29523 RepID=UPI00261F6020|nr:LytTR family DNA-binding domain-containing protein [Bacteroides sp.]
MQIKCVITDDEPTACEGLRRYVEKVDFLSLTAVCEDAMQLNTFLQTQQPDLLFLDIEMPYLSGLELLASLAHPPRVIVTSAYEQYALKGYELDVADYLLKPISFERFLKAVNKVYNLLQQEVQLEEITDFIFVRSDRQMHKVFLKDILIVEGLENYVCIYTENSKLLVRSTMKRMAEVLPNEVFLQVHKSYLINQEKIDMIDGNQIVVGQHTIPVARNFREEVFARIIRNTL